MSEMDVWGSGSLMRQGYIKNNCMKNVRPNGVCTYGKMTDAVQPNYGGMCSIGSPYLAPSDYVPQVNKLYITRKTQCRGMNYPCEPACGNACYSNGQIYLME